MLAALALLPVLQVSSLALAAPGARVVAVGDLHGDLPAALEVLALAGVIDEEGHWAGGTTTLVQTGDTTDRGSDSRGVMDLLRRLAPEAEAAGGRVVALLGNHESMNLLGDWRYVAPGDVAAFGGLDARRDAFALTGSYGAWLRTLDAVAVVEGTAFVHGGVTPSWAARGLEGINTAVREGLDTPGHPALGATGPLWYRGFVQDPEAEACPRLEESLRALEAQRMVVGHTTRRDGRIASRCEGRLQVIDVGISTAYGRHLAAWEWIDGDARALTPDGRVDLPDPPSLEDDGAVREVER